MEDSYVIGYLEIPEDYWTITTTINVKNPEEDPDKYWHHGEDN